MCNFWCGLAKADWRWISFKKPRIWSFLFKVNASYANLLTRHFEQWVNYGKVITPTTWQPTLFILWGGRNGAWFSIQNKELEGWNFKRLSLEVTFCGLTILTVPHPSHILLTSLSNTETRPRKIRPQMESERCRSARRKHVIASESYPVEAKRILCHLLPFLCHYGTWSSPGSQGWDSKARCGGNDWANTVVSSIVPWVLMNGKRLVYENKLVCSLLGKRVWGGKVITRKSSTQS